MENLVLSEKEILLEEILIDEAKENPQRFRPLYEKYYNKIFRFIYSKVEGKEESADLTSQVFLKALLHLPNYQHRNLPFSSWLYRIAYNEVLQYFRKVKKESVIHINENFLLNLAEEVDATDLENLKIHLETTLQDLKIEELEIIQLRFYQALSFKEIGLILNISENNAKVKTYRLLEKIRKKIS